MSVENRLDSNVLSVTENSINSLILKDILKISILCFQNSVKVSQFIEQEQYLDTKEAQITKRNLNQRNMNIDQNYIAKL